VEGVPTKHLPTEGAAKLGQETSVQAIQQDLVLLARWKPGAVQGHRGLAQERVQARALLAQQHIYAEDGVWEVQQVLGQEQVQALALLAQQNTSDANE
jgi:hypothetical protein